MPYGMLTSFDDMGDWGQLPEEETMAEPNCESLPEIIQETHELQRIAKVLSESLANLVSKLTPVISPANPSGKSPTDEHASTPLGQNLCATRLMISDLLDQVEDLILRIKL